MQDVVADVMNHWISCNVYTTTRKTVRSRLAILVNTYHQLKRTTQKKKGPTFENNLKDFSKHCERLFDIRCIDKK